MLIDDFFSIVRKETDPHTVNATISLRKNHPIFTGHFPGMPVVPGVCMIQIVREVMEAVKNVKLRLVSAENIKFLSVINPNEIREVEVSLDFQITDNDCAMQARIFSGEIIYFKFKGLFAIAQ